ncbi:Leucine aminopeptidase 1 [Thoreauomyces humboldtii]|nr:Leucine aminopeptidase 1 [Thoreauomyces humboldtii]
MRSSKASLLLLSAATLGLWSVSVSDALPITGGFSSLQKILGLSDDSKRLISTAHGVTQWMDENQVFDLIRGKTSFVDVTDRDIAWDSTPIKSLVAASFPSAATQQDHLHPLISEIDTDRMKEFLTEFSTRHHTRYYKVQSGKDASDWIHDRALEQALEANAKGHFKVTVDKFAHPWAQSSVIVRVLPAASDSLVDDHAVVISAHLDSVNQWNPYWGRSPGADDDGSGTTTIFEAYRLLLSSTTPINRPVEFHFYSAEEGGLLGSQKVVAQYVKERTPVVAMLQVDMTGYQPPNKKEVVGIATDNIDKQLSGFLQVVASEYCAVPWADVKCGYGCSDHASWNQAGFPASFAFEAPFDQSSPYIHTASDDVSHISFSHMKEFVKLVLAFGVELGIAKR